MLCTRTPNASRLRSASNFAARVIRLKRASKLRAAAGVSNLAQAAKATGKRERVYLLARPSIWAFSRRCKSGVQPVYSEPSEHRRI